MSVDPTALRTTVAAALVTGLDQTMYAVYAYPYTPQNMSGGRGAVVVYRESVSRDGDGFGLATSTLVCQVIEPMTDLSRAEDSLDQRLKDVMAVFKSLGFCAFKSAQRVVIGEFAAYTLTYESTHGA